MIISGDLVEQQVDAIVNAFQQRPGPRRGCGECDTHGPVKVGDAAITGARELPARCIDGRMVAGRGPFVLFGEAAKHAFEGPFSATLKVI